LARSGYGTAHLPPFRRGDNLDMSSGKKGKTPGAQASANPGRGSRSIGKNNLNPQNSTKSVGPPGPKHADLPPGWQDGGRMVRAWDVGDGGSLGPKRSKALANWSPAVSRWLFHAGARPRRRTLFCAEPGPIQSKLPREGGNQWDPTATHNDRNRWAATGFEKLRETARALYANRAGRKEQNGPIWQMADNGRLMGNWQENTDWRLRDIMVMGGAARQLPIEPPDRRRICPARKNETAGADRPAPGLGASETRIWQEAKRHSRARRDELFEHRGQSHAEPMPPDTALPSPLAYSRADRPSAIRGVESRGWRRGSFAVHPHLSAP